MAAGVAVIAGVIGVSAAPATAADDGGITVQASSSYSVKNSFASSSGTKSWSSRQYVRVSGSITDARTNPSTSYAYLSWEEWNHGAWTKQNKQVGRAANGAGGSVSGSFVTPYDVRNVKVTVCSSAGDWYCGSPG
jgi:hypothetical protein